MSSIFQEILITKKERKTERQKERKKERKRIELSKSLTRSMQDRSRNKVTLHDVCFAEAGSQTASCAQVQCPTQKPAGCRGVIPPGACCPVCGRFFTLKGIQSFVIQDV
jgi:hypothetical protein